MDNALTTIARLNIPLKNKIVQDFQNIFARVVVAYFGCNTPRRYLRMKSLRIFFRLTMKIIS